MKSRWISLYLLAWILLVIYSFSRLDLNLTLYSSKSLSIFKNKLQYLGYYQRSWATSIYFFLITFIYFAYSKIIYTRLKLKPKHILITLTILGFGIFSYPMFSHDIFNYLFNAKMVLVYHANPHLHTALEFSGDTWTRFMHNVHSPAPYAYGWTAISLLPVYLGLPSFTFSFWFTKLLIIFFFCLEIYVFYLISKVKFRKQAIKRTLMLALNPLILVETLINGHNDSLMMFFIFLSFYLLEIKSNWKSKVFSSLSFVASVMIKYATIILIPLWWFKSRVKDLYGWGGIFLLLILLTRPGQLNSWYLHWGISFLFLSKNTKLIHLGLLLSFGGLLRYIPFIYYGHWNYPVTIWRWTLLLLPLTLIYDFRSKNI